MTYEESSRAARPDARLATNAIVRLWTWPADDSLGDVALGCSAIGVWADLRVSTTAAFVRAGENTRVGGVRGRPREPLPSRRAFRSAMCPEVCWWARLEVTAGGGRLPR
jgi:hypothetical protein